MPLKEEEAPMLTPPRPHEDRDGQGSSPLKTNGSATVPIPPEDAPPFGNSRRCCGDRCLIAPDCHATAIVIVLVLCFDGLLSYIWATQDLSKLWIVVANCIFTLLVVITITLTSTTDPGVIPKLKHNDPRVKPPPPKGMSEFVTIQGVQVVTKYCHTCRRTRPPRASHCQTCNNCVQKFDHHCGVIGACIGAGNIRYFFAFLVSLVLKSLWITTFSTYYLISFWSSGNMVKNGLAIVNTVVGIAITFQIGAMVVHYIRLFSNGYTQRENIKRDQLYGKDTKNPFDYGCTDNWYEIWCI